MRALAEVRLWGSRIGAVLLQDGETTATFEYDPAFLESAIEPAPLMMPLRTGLYSFPALPQRSFHGLPGMLADSLPDKYGHALIDAWLATQGRTPNDFNAVERLSYVGARGMGALEFQPTRGPSSKHTDPINIDALVRLASEVLSHRASLRVSFGDPNRANALREILKVGTSAGGARAKAVIAWHPGTHEVRSGQVTAPDGFEYWLIKFDGVSSNKDKELADPMGFGAVEYAYALMAKEAGIAMTPCRLLEEGGRRHFMTQRFDRTADGGKLHMQSLAALAHFDFNDAAAYSYEQAFLVLRQLELPSAQAEQLFRRMAFNVIARNQDDHVKNIAFLMTRDGSWSLSPAYDVTWSYNPEGDWTSQHQMSLNGKRDHFVAADLLAAAGAANIKARRAKEIIGELTASVRRWPEHAAAAGVRAEWAEDIATSHRLTLA